MKFSTAGLTCKVIHPTQAADEVAEHCGLNLRHLYDTSQGVRETDHNEIHVKEEESHEEHQMRTQDNLTICETS